MYHPSCRSNKANDEYLIIIKKVNRSFQVQHAVRDLHNTYRERGG